MHEIALISCGLLAEKNNIYVQYVLYNYISRTQEPGMPYSFGTVKNGPFDRSREGVGGRTKEQQGASRYLFARRLLDCSSE